MYTLIIFLIIIIYMLFAVREVRIRKNCAQGVEYGPRPRVVLKTKVTVFPNTDRPTMANNMFIFFFGTALKATFVLNFLLKKFSSNLAYAHAFTKK